MSGWNSLSMNGYPLAGLAPKPARQRGQPKKERIPRLDRMDLSAPVIYLPPAHPGVQPRLRRAPVDTKPTLETFSGRARLTARCILKTPAEVLDEVRALSGSITEAEMNRLFEDLDVERLIVRALNRRDPHNRMDAMDRRLLFVAETAGRGRYWLEHQLDWRGFGGESRAERETLLLKVHGRLCEEHRIYTYSLHALDRHAELAGMSRRESLLALAAAADQGRALLEPNGHALHHAHDVAAFLAAVHREKGLPGLVLDDDLDCILCYAKHEAEAAEAARNDMVARVEENTRIQPGLEIPDLHRSGMRNAGLPKPPPPLMPVNWPWVALRLCALLVFLGIVCGLVRILAGNGANPSQREEHQHAADWYDLMPKPSGS